MVVNGSDSGDANKPITSSNDIAAAVSSSDALSNKDTTALYVASVFLPASAAISFCAKILTDLCNVLLLIIFIFCTVTCHCCES